MARLAFGLLLAGGIASMLLGGCNAVLGIEEATLRDEGSTDSGALTIPIASCNEPKQNCGTCAASQCAATYPSCEADRECRDKLDDYRACLGSSCGESGCIAVLKGVGKSGDLASCVEVECPGCVDTSPLASICELYCSCMLSDCSTVSGLNVPWTPANEMLSCMAQCNSLGLASAHCRFTHCQLRKESAAHCSHAIDEGTCPKDAIAGSDCSLRAKGWGCREGAQCCSNSCRNNICD